MNNDPKKILLINSHFGIGGIESAMVNMANSLCEQYDVDLFVYYPEGPMKERLNPRVKVLKPSLAIKILGMTVAEALRSKNPLIILLRLLGAAWSHVFDNRLPIYISTKLQPKLKGYDLAIAYRQENVKNELLSGFARVLHRCVEANAKVGWIHCDATYFPEMQEFNRKYYEHIDKIVGVSHAVSKAFASMNPKFKEKTDYCYNFMNYDMLSCKSKEEQTTEYAEDSFICFSACRFSPGKAITRTISAITPIMHAHNDVMWYIAGDGPERSRIENAIAEAGLKKQIILLGNQSNPYPYMKNADLLMLLSYHEAAPMVYMEAKALHVPVFSTDTLSAHEMLKDGEQDFICGNSEEEIREKFLYIVENRELVEKAKEALKDYTADNERSINKINELMNG